MYLASIKGSLTATTSISSLEDAIRNTNLPIRPKPVKDDHHGYVVICWKNEITSVCHTNLTCFCRAKKPPSSCIDISNGTSEKR